MSNCQKVQFNIKNMQNTQNNSLISQLLHLVKFNLEKSLFINAVFYSERLLTELDNEDTRFLLAQSYYGNLTQLT